jgi:putative FmdB family regulatory protein
MPLYDFECPRCQTREERLLRPSQSSEPQRCEVCGGELRRMLSAPATVGGCSEGPSGFT